MILKDNSHYFSTSENLEEFLSLQNVANRTLSELTEECGNNLLIYPYSFEKCEDKIGNQPLMSLQANWKGKQCTKVHLTTGNLVGFIGVNGHSVSIQSRFVQHSGEDFFLHYMLQKVLFLNLFRMPHRTNDEAVFDFLLYLFPKFLNEALAQGIYKEYQRNAYNDANVRGVIDISRQIKCNIPFNGRIAYRTREFSQDNQVTELIRHTLEYICTTRFGKVLLESDTQTRDSVTQIRTATPNYHRQDRENVIRHNLKIIPHPYFTRYAPLQKLCLRILRHEKIKYGPKENKIHGILFDAAYLWEEYLATILTKQGFTHPNNKKGTGRVYLAKGHKFPRYLDFFRESDGTIVDAKYKTVTEKREDIHQLITYMYRLRGKQGILIHPTFQAHATAQHSLRGYGEDNNANLETYLFHIPQQTADYQDFISKIAVSEELLRKHLQGNKT